MSKFLLLFALFFVAAFFLFLKKKRRSDVSSSPWPFYVRPLLSSPEQVLYHRLVEALPGRMVLAQVQVSRVLRVKKGFKVSEWLNRINRMSYDFVVCLKDSSVIAIIELDDGTHRAAGRAVITS